MVLKTCLHWENVLICELIDMETKRSQSGLRVNYSGLETEQETKVL